MVVASSHVVIMICNLSIENHDLATLVQSSCHLVMKREHVH